MTLISSLCNDLLSLFPLSTSSLPCSKSISPFLKRCRIPIFRLMLTSLVVDLPCSIKAAKKSYKIYLTCSDYNPATKERAGKLMLITVPFSFNSYKNYPVYDTFILLSIMSSGSPHHLNFPASIKSLLGKYFMAFVSLSFIKIPMKRVSIPLSLWSSWLLRNLDRALTTLKMFLKCSFALSLYSFYCPFSCLA